MKHLEDRLQMACVNWFRYQYPQYAKLLFAIPNGGARTKAEGGILKATGSTAGVSDMILLIARGGFNSLCVEFKTEVGKQSISQREWQIESEKHQNKYIICRSVEAFINEINGYLKI